MRYDPKLHHRHSIRLQTYDYSQAGAYFVTLCTQDRKYRFGAVINGEMVLNQCGRIVEVEWFRSAEIRKEVRLDAFVVMPNHLHGVVFIDQMTSDESAYVGAHGCAPNGLLHRPRRSLGAFIAGFKSIVTTTINQLHNTPGVTVWQRNYYDHIIRKEEALEKIRCYIANNPANWEKDKNNLSANVWM